jgi:hypothetical protein
MRPTSPVRTFRLARQRTRARGLSCDGRGIGPGATVVVVGPLYTGALIAKDLGDTGAEAERRFALTLDHDIVTAAARILLNRVAALAA